MHIEYWECDKCGKVIEYETSKKFPTKEKGYPYILSISKGKHYHFSCMLDFLNSKKNLTKVERAELIEDAERRHEKKIKNKKLTKGKLTDKKVKEITNSKADRESLINYFMSHYGLTAPSKKLSTLINKLNAGEDYDNYIGICIPFDQLEKMLIFYKKDLDSTYNNKLKKGNVMEPPQRIYYDINVVVNRLDDYLKMSDNLNTNSHSSSINNGGEVADNSKIMKNVDSMRRKAAEKSLKEAEEKRRALREELDNM